MRKKQLTTKRPGRPPASPPNEPTDLAEHFVSSLRAAVDADPANDRTEGYRRMLRSGTHGTFRVIDAAHTDRRADVALRQHIAEMIDRGEELTTQLRAYAVRYLVNPLDVLRRRER